MTEQLTVGGLIYELKKLDSSLLVWCASKRMRVKPAVEVILCTEKSSKREEKWVEINGEDGDEE